MKIILHIEASLTGAGLQTLKYCLQKQYYSILLTSNPAKYQDLLQQLQDEFHQQLDISKCITIEKVNTSDYLLLYSKIKQLASSQNIDGILTTSDIHVPQTCFMAESFKTPWLSYNGAATARDKFLMRHALEKTNPALNPKFCVATTFEDAKQKIIALGGYPFIAKPRNSNDSIGVARIKSEKDLLNYFQEYTSSAYDLPGVVYPEEVLLESYINGQEFSIETLHRGDSAPIILGISQKNDFGGKITHFDQDNIEPGNYTELSLSFPSTNLTALEMAKQIPGVLSNLTIDYGIIHTEFKITLDNQIKILEINPRLAGDMLGSHCIPFATGINTAQTLIELALGNKDAVSCVATKNHSAAIIGIYAKNKGKFAGFTNLTEIEDFLTQKALDHHIIVWKKPGEMIRPPQSNADLLGRIAVEANSTSEALLLCRQAVNNLTISYLPSYGVELVAKEGISWFNI